jgi:ribose-phosphate pyrophosphokinase
MFYSSLQIIAGNANRRLADGIAKYLQRPLAEASADRFPDGEINVKINSDVRGSDAFVIQPTCHPVNENLMELLIFIDTLRRASAGRITAVVPYYGYARKDRKDEGRVPITAKLVANLITAAGADRVLTVDLHAQQIQGFFDIPVDHLYAMPVLLRRYREVRLDNLVVVSPDVGGVRVARAYSKALDTPLAIVEKRRLSAEAAEAEFLIGNVEGKNVLMVDDLISTAGTLSQAAKLLKAHGAQSIHVAATHAILCGPAMDRIQQAPIVKVTVTDTIPVGDAVRACPKIEIVSVANILGEAIRRIHKDESVSSLFLDQ